MLHNIGSVAEWHASRCMRSRPRSVRGARPPPGPPPPAGTSTIEPGSQPRRESGRWPRGRRGRSARPLRLAVVLSRNARYPRIRRHDRRKSPDPSRTVNRCRLQPGGDRSVSAGLTVLTAWGDRAARHGGHHPPRPRPRPRPWSWSRMRRTARSGRSSGRDRRRPPALGRTPVAEAGYSSVETGTVSATPAAATVACSSSVRTSV